MNNEENKGALNNLDSIKIDQDGVKAITNLYEHKGKDFYYKETLNKDMESIKQGVIINDCKAIMKFKDLKVSDTRFKNLVKFKTKPKNKDESVIASTAYIIKGFQEHINEFDIMPNQFLNIGRLLFKDIKSINFKSYSKKVKRNLIYEDKNYNNRDVLNNILITYNAKINSRKYEIVSVIASFFIDFMMEDIFDDENEIIGIFALYALLFKNGFELFRFTSFLEEFFNNYDEFKDCLAKSEYGWHDGYPNASYLTNFLRQIMINCYAKIDMSMNKIKIIAGNQKTNMIEYSILKTVPDVFTKEMIQELNPNASLTTINRTLMRLRDENKIIPNGTGRSATWTRIYKSSKKFEQQDIVKQFSIEDFIPDENYVSPEK